MVERAQKLTKSVSHFSSLEENQSRNESHWLHFLYFSLSSSLTDVGLEGSSSDSKNWLETNRCTRRNLFHVWEKGLYKKDMRKN